MIYLIGVSTILILWVLVLLIGHGYANTIELIGILLVRHARSIRSMHVRRTEVINRWYEEL